MRFPRPCPAFISASGLLVFLLGDSILTIASALDSSYHAPQANHPGPLLMQRQEDNKCNNFCGHDNSYCCPENAVCTTSNGIAGCTMTATELSSSSPSSIIVHTTTMSFGDCVPPEGSGQIPCGPICCSSSQYCDFRGRCRNLRIEDLTSVTTDFVSASPTTPPIASETGPGESEATTTSTTTNEGGDTMPVGTEPAEATQSSPPDSGVLSVKGHIPGAVAALLVLVVSMVHL